MGFKITRSKTIVCLLFVVAPVLVSIEHYKRNRQFYESIIKYHLQPLLQDPEDLHIFVASAHVLHNEFRPNTYTVRLNAMARDLSVHLARHHSEVNGMYCKSDNGEVAQFRLYLMDAPPACAWKNYFIDCEFLSPVEAVEIVSVDSSGTGFPIELTPNQIEKRNLVVCFARTFYFENWQVLLVLFEIYRHHGVDQFVLPIISITEKIYEFLERYKNYIILRLKKGFLLPEIKGLPNPNFETDSLNLILSSNECLFEYRNSAEFLIFADTDDLILPNSGESLVDFARDLLSHNRMASSFEFMWKGIQFPIRHKAEAFSLTGIMNNTFTIRTNTIGKSILMPKRVAMAVIHAPWTSNQRVHPYEHIKFENGKVGSAFHMRFPVNEQDAEKWMKEKELKPLVDVDYSQADYELKLRLEKDAVLKTQFLSLDGYPVYYPLMVECWSQIVQFRGHGIDVCPTTKNCQPKSNTPLPSCVVLKSDFKAMTFERPTHLISVYKPVERELRVKEDCGFFES
ncbi:unnamed protein product [Bursaphelenchus xylophilus]|uniref:Glycosyltransferase family 92 protein n=1 Tax=Bursaphelenchus xylophilus TaxID=6326 RepID=A0A1I7RUA8_BURXY|nr:unnamed protein product [Bursaphelenchus xylophilus]CAG9113992.1 unnamed protein product [Bursaphelenchus xylophilus]